jgi:Bacterial CdiA-CT RNAse A domain
MQRVAGDVGYGIVRQTGKLTLMNNVVVVLKYQTCNGMPYYILTAYVG